MADNIIINVYDEIIKDISDIQLMNLSTLSSHSIETQKWVQSNQALILAWQEGSDPNNPLLVALNKALSEQDPDKKIKALRDLIDEHAGKDPDKFLWNSTLIQEVAAALGTATKYDKDADGVRLGLLNQQATITSSQANINASTGDSEVKAWQSQSSQDLSAQQVFSDIAQATNGVGAALPGIQSQLFA